MLSVWIVLFIPGHVGALEGTLETEVDEAVVDENEGPDTKVVEEIDEDVLSEDELNAKFIETTKEDEADEELVVVVDSDDDNTVEPEDDVADPELEIEESTVIEL